MATKKTPVNSKLLEVAEAATPENPALSSADKAYLRGLRRRGFTQQEIQAVAQKAGFQVPVDLFAPRGRPAQTKPPQPQR